MSSSNVEILEKRKTILAPAGPLRIVIGNPGDMSPGVVVSEVKEESALKGKIYVGDRIVCMNCAQVKSTADFEGIQDQRVLGVWSTEPDDSSPEKRSEANVTVQVPKGNLGLVMSNDFHVTDVFEDSPLLGKIFPYDRLVTVGGEDIRDFSKEELLEFLSCRYVKKSKMGFIRAASATVSIPEAIWTFDASRSTISAATAGAKRQAPAPAAGAQIMAPAKNKIPNLSEKKTTQDAPTSKTAVSMENNTVKEENAKSIHDSAIAAAAVEDQTELTRKTLPTLDKKTTRNASAALTKVKKTPQPASTDQASPASEPPLPKTSMTPNKIPNLSEKKTTQDAPTSKTAGSMENNTVKEENAKSIHDSAIAAAAVEDQTEQTRKTLPTLDKRTTRNASAALTKVTKTPQPASTDQASSASEPPLQKTSMTPGRGKNSTSRKSVSKTSDKKTTPMRVTRAASKEQTHGRRKSPARKGKAASPKNAVAAAVGKIPKKKRFQVVSSSEPQLPPRTTITPGRASRKAVSIEASVSQPAKLCITPKHEQNAIGRKMGAASAGDQDPKTIKIRKTAIVKASDIKRPRTRSSSITPSPGHNSSTRKMAAVSTGGQVPKTSITQGEGEISNPASKREMRPTNPPSSASRRENETNNENTAGAVSESRSERGCGTKGRTAHSTATATTESQTKANASSSPDGNSQKPNGKASASQVRPNKHTRRGYNIKTYSKGAQISKKDGYSSNDDCATTRLEVERTESRAATKRRRVSHTDARPTNPATTSDNSTLFPEKNPVTSQAAKNALSEKTTDMLQQQHAPRKTTSRDDPLTNRETAAGASIESHMPNNLRRRSLPTRSMASRGVQQPTSLPTRSMTSSGVPHPISRSMMSNRVQHPTNDGTTSTVANGTRNKTRKTADTERNAGSVSAGTRRSEVSSQGERPKTAGRSRKKREVHHFNPEDISQDEQAKRKRGRPSNITKLDNDFNPEPTALAVIESPNRTETLTKVECVDDESTDTTKKQGELSPGRKAFATNLLETQIPKASSTSSGEKAAPNLETNFTRTVAAGTAPSNPSQGAHQSHDEHTIESVNDKRTVGATMGSHVTKEHNAFSGNDIIQNSCVAAENDFASDREGKCDTSIRSIAAARAQPKKSTTAYDMKASNLDSNTTAPRKSNAPAGPVRNPTATAQTDSPGEARDNPDPTKRGFQDSQTSAYIDEAANAEAKTSHDVSAKRKRYASQNGNSANLQTCVARISEIQSPRKISRTNGCNRNPGDHETHLAKLAESQMHKPGDALDIGELADNVFTTGAATKNQTPVTTAVLHLDEMSIEHGSPSTQSRTIKHIMPPTPRPLLNMNGGSLVEPIPQVADLQALEPKLQPSRAPLDANTGSLVEPIPQVAALQTFEPNEEPPYPDPITDVITDVIHPGAPPRSSSPEVIDLVTSEDFETRNPYLPDAFWNLKVLENRTQSTSVDRLAVKEAILSVYDLDQSIKKLESALSVMEGCERAHKLQSELVDSEKKKRDAILSFDAGKLTDLELGMRQLVLFKIEHGHCDINPQNARDVFSKFVQECQSRYQELDQKDLLNEDISRLSFDHPTLTASDNRQRFIVWQQDIRLLEAFGFKSWKSQESWEESCERLMSYIEVEGHCDVPKSYKDEDGFLLGSWVANQRKQYERWNCQETTAMNADRILMLEEIGFVWKLRTG